MDEFVALSGPLIGMLGVIVGTLLNEYLRRGRRAEQYSSVIFSKRLEAYETLTNLIHEGTKKADDAIHNANLSHEERHELISMAIFDITQHLDRNALYVDEELAAHCVALFMGTEDIQGMPESERQEALRKYYEMRSETFRVISEDAGIAQVNRLFRSINRPRIAGPVIERIRELRRERRKAR